MSSVAVQAVPASWPQPYTEAALPFSAEAAPVRVIQPYQGRAARDLATHGMGSVFGSPQWAEVLSATYGIDVNASSLVRDGATRAAILFSKIEDIRGTRILSLPFSDYVDPLVETAKDWNDLVEPLLEMNVPVRFRCLRNSLPAEDPRFTLTGTALWHAADLTRPEDDIWANLKDSGRQNIRKAQRSGVVVRQGRTLDDLRIFYRMHGHVRKSKYRLFAQPFSFFEALHAVFAPTDSIFVLLAEIDGTAIGGILFLIHGDTLYYKFNASTEAELRPNDLLVWNGIRIGQEAGLKSLDFGLSDIEQPGLVRFKRKFATLERTISMLQWTPAGYADERGQEATKILHRLTAILTTSETPDEITRAVGDEIYRYFC